MNLIIDIGNSFTKVAIYEASRLRNKYILDEINYEKIETLIKQYDTSRGIVCAVGSLPDFIASLSIPIELLDQETNIPVINSYASPETLGYDRLAAVIGASTLFPNKPILCVDTGTCITYDLLDDEGIYCGGAISPGIDIRFKSLSSFTEKLPLVNIDKPFVSIDPIGNDTKTSIESGVFWGIVEEFNGTIERYRTKYPKLQTVLTGGNAYLFESFIKSQIFASPNSVLHGLNAILEYNK